MSKDPSDVPGLCCCYLMVIQKRIIEFTSHQSIVYNPAWISERIKVASACIGFCDLTLDLWVKMIAVGGGSESRSSLDP